MADFPLSRNSADPYSPNMVKDLLNGINDWRNVEDIVRITFKALSDVVTAQASSIRELERQLPYKASKQELTSALTLKVNSTDISRTITEIVEQVDRKVDMDDIRRLLDERVTRDEFKHEVQHILHQSAARDDIDHLTRGKLDSAEFQNTLYELKKELDQLHESASRQPAIESDLERLYSILDTKANAQELRETNLGLERRADKAELDVIYNLLSQNKKEISNEITSSYTALEHKLQNLRSDTCTIIDRIDHDRTQDLERIQDIENTKASVADLTSALNTVQLDIEQFVNQLKTDMMVRSRSLEDGIINKYDAEVSAISKEILSFKTSTQENRNADDMKSSQRLGELNQQLEITAKTIREELDSAKYNLNKYIDGVNEQKLNIRDFDAMIQKVRQEQDQASQNLADQLRYTDGDIRAVLESHQVSLGEKADMGLMNKSVNLKAGKDELHILQDRVQDVTNQMRNLCTEFENHLHQTKRQFADISSDLDFTKQKTSDNISELGIELAEKNQMSRSVSQDVQRSIDQLFMRCTQNSDDLQAHTNDQTLINETLCSENCIGRWIWKNGYVLHGYAVPWEIQSINTCPENFLWEKDDSTIMTIAPGLYEITLGFFSLSIPTVKLLVNGSVALVSDATIQKNLTGYTMHEFVALPERASLVVSYSGDPGSEGFIGVKKL